MSKDQLIFGTVGAPPSTPKKPGGSPGTIAHLKALGLDALELAWVQSVSITPAGCAAIRAARDEHQFQLSVHAPYYINLNALTPEGWAASRERLLKAARMGYLAGATDIVFHPGSYHSQAPEQVYPLVRDRLAEVMQTLRREGIAVTLRPETTGKSALFGTLEETIRLSQDIEGVLPCVDVAHLHARTGDGSLNSCAEFKAVLQSLKKGLGSRGIHQLHLHLSGIAYSPKGERHHLMLSEADLDYTALLQALVDMGARGRVMCESPQQDVDALLLQKTYRQMVKR